MNSNSFIASLTDGYGRRISSDMIEALGLEEEDEFELPGAPPALTFEAYPSLIGRAANANLRLAG